MFLLFALIAALLGNYGIAIMFVVFHLLIEMDEE